MEKVNTYATRTRLGNHNVFDYCPRIHPANISKAQTGLILSESFGFVAISVEVATVVWPVAFVAASIAQVLLFLSFLVESDVSVTKWLVRSQSDLYHKIHCYLEQFKPRSLSFRLERLQFFLFTAIVNVEDEAEQFQVVDMMRGLGQEKISCHAIEWRNSSYLK